MEKVLVDNLQINLSLSTVESAVRLYHTAVSCSQSSKYE